MVKDEFSRKGSAIDRIHAENKDPLLVGNTKKQGVL